MNSNTLIIRMIKAPLRPFVWKFNKIRNLYYLHRPTYIFYLRKKLLGDTWLNYYSRLVSAGVDLNVPLNQSRIKYIEQGEQQAQILLENGLKPNHTILDLGRGCLRLAHYLLNYLEPNHYFCAAIAKARMTQGIQYLEQKGFNYGSYSVNLLHDLTLSEYAGKKFNFIWTSSFFTHMPLDHLEILLSSLKNIINYETKFLFTFSTKVDSVSEPLAKSKSFGCNFFYTELDLEKLFEKFNYEFTVIKRGFLFPETSIGMAYLKGGHV